MIMQFHKSGYYHQHDKDFRIERPDGSGDYLLLLVRTAGWFRIHGTDYHTSPNTILLYKKGTPQLYRACEAIYSDDWLHFHMDESDLSFVSKLEIPFDTPVQVHDIHDLSLLIKDITYEHYSDNIFFSIYRFCCLRSVKSCIRMHISRTTFTMTSCPICAPRFITCPIKTGTWRASVPPCP